MFTSTTRGLTKAIVKQHILTRRARKRHGKRALGFAQKFRKLKAKRPKPSLRRSVSCPATIETEACPPTAPERKVLVLGTQERCFPEERQLCIRHDHVQILPDPDPSCDDSGCDDSPELDRGPSRPPNFAPSCSGASLAHHLRLEIQTTEEAIKRNVSHIDFVRNSESECETNYPWTNCFRIGSKIVAKNQRLLAETLLILTAALKDIPDNLRTCDCQFLCQGQGLSNPTCISANAVPA